MVASILPQRHEYYDYADGRYLVLVGRDLVTVAKSGYSDNNLLPVIVITGERSQVFGEGDKNIWLRWYWSIVAMTVWLEFKELVTREIL